MEVARGEVQLLEIVMPPRYGKSELVSRRFPAWYLGQFPTRDIIAGSYGGELVSGFGRELRNLMNGERHLEIFPDADLLTDSQAKNRWTHRTRRHVHRRRRRRCDNRLWLQPRHYRRSGEVPRRSALGAHAGHRVALVPVRFPVAPDAALGHRAGELRGGMKWTCPAACRLRLGRALQAHPLSGHQRAGRSPVA